MSTTASAPTDTSACCTSMLGPGLTTDRADELASVFKALGDPARLRLLSLIAAGDGNEACVCDLTEPLGLSQPTVSHHMKKLAAAGLVVREQRGRWAYYRLAPGALENLSAALV